MGPSFTLFCFLLPPMAKEHLAVKVSDLKESSACLGKMKGLLFLFFKRKKKKHTKGHQMSASRTSSGQWLKPQTQKRQVWWIFRRLEQGLLWSIPQNHTSLGWEIGVFPVLWWGLYLLRSRKRKKSSTDLSDDGIIKTFYLLSFQFFLIVQWPFLLNGEERALLP